MAEPRVLIVDDDDDIRESVIEILEDEGHPAFGAVNGADALFKLRTSDELPAVILLDIMMPGMDGKTFRKEQVADPRLASIPVVLMSADAHVEETASFLKVDGYLKKPVHLAELFKVAETYLPKRV
jgi:CheY-like chemotaxis protein